MSLPSGGSRPATGNSKTHGGRMRLRYFAVSLLCLAAGVAGAQSTTSKSTQAGKSPELRIDYTQETLPNGLTGVFHREYSTPLAARLFLCKVGAEDGAARRTRGG